MLTAIRYLKRWLHVMFPWPNRVLGLSSRWWIYIWPDYHVEGRNVAGLHRQFVSTYQCRKFVHK